MAKKETELIQEFKKGKNKGHGRSSMETYTVGVALIKKTEPKLKYLSSITKNGRSTTL